MTEDVPRCLSESVQGVSERIPREVRLSGSVESGYGEHQGSIKGAL